MRGYYIGLIMIATLFCNVVAGAQNLSNSIATFGEIQASSIDRARTKLLRGRIKVVLVKIVNDQVEGELGDKFWRELQNDHEKFLDDYFSEDTQLNCAPVRKSTSYKCVIDGAVNVIKLRKSVKDFNRQIRGSSGKIPSIILKSPINASDIEADVSTTLIGNLLGQGYQIRSDEAGNEDIGNDKADYFLVLRRIEISRPSIDRSSGRVMISGNASYTIKDNRTGNLIASKPVRVSSARYSDFEVAKKDIIDKIAAELARVTSDSLLTNRFDLRDDKALEKNSLDGMRSAEFRLNGVTPSSPQATAFLQMLKSANLSTAKINYAKSKDNYTTFTAKVLPSFDPDRVMGAFYRTYAANPNKDMSFDGVGFFDVRL